MNKRRLFYSIPVILLLIVVVAGWFATDYLGNKARQEIISESQASVLTLSIYVSSTFTNIEGAVKSLAGSPWISPALLSQKDQDIEHAHSALDRYSSAIKASVSYLMDAEGLTVASSNRKDPDSFVGKSYRFRPYFQEAAKGKAGRYFALGITSGKRGFYASYPVQDDLGKVLGVVAMKKDLDEIEAFFSRHSFCFLISPDGVIFLSSKPAMVLKSLWPLDKTAQEKLIAFKQFGNKLSEAVFKKEIADGTEVALEGKDYFVSRKVIDADGWSIVLLAPTDRIGLYKWIGILATIFVCLLIMVFSGIVYVTDRSKEAIRQNEERYRAITQTANDAIITTNGEGTIVGWNPSAEKMFGYTETEINDQPLTRLMPLRYRKLHLEGMDRMQDSGEQHVIGKTVQLEGLRRDASEFPIEFSLTDWETAEGRFYTAILRDITKRKRVEAELLEKEYFLSEAQRLGHVGSWFFDMRGPISWSEEMYRIYEVSPDTFIPTPESLISLIHPDDQAAMRSWIAACAAGEKPGELEYRTKMPDGAIRFLRGHGEAIYDGENKLIHMAGTVQDITERKKSEEKIRQMAYHDSLTGLPNRKLFSDRLGIALTQSQRNQQKVGVAMLDLDKFKSVNDTLGHDVGDLLLQATAERLSAALRKGDTVARFGGDEFVLILPDLKEIEDAIQVAQKIVDSFSKPFLIDTHQLVVTTSIGIAVYPGDGIDEGILLKNADIAMYAAKQAGRGRYQLWEKA